MSRENENEWQQAPERLENLEKAVRDAEFEWLLEKDELWLNDIFISTYHYSKEEVGVHSDWWIACVHPEDRDAVTIHLKQSISTGEPCQINYRFKRGDQSYAYIYGRIYPVRGETGITRLRGVMTDISAYILSERKKGDSEKQMQFALQSAEVGTWDMNPADNSVVWDERCRDLFGFSGSGAVTLEDVFSYIHPEDLIRVKSAVSNALDFHTGGLYDIRFRTTDPEGNTIRTIHCRGKAYFDIEGTAYRFSGTALDISRQAEASEKAESAERLAQLAVEGAGAGTFLIDFEKDIFTYSDLLVIMLTGNAYNNLSREVMVSYIHPEDKDKRDAAYQAAFQTGKLQYEARFIWDDGSVHWVKMLGSYVYSPTGKPLRFMGISQDITPEIKAREEQQKLLSLVENSPDFMGIIDREELTYVNRAGRDLLGLDPDADLNQMKSREIYSRAFQYRGLKELLQSLTTHGQFSGKVQLKNIREKTTIPAQANYITINDPVTGAVMASGAIIRDLRPDIAARQALEESEKQFRNILIEAPVATALFSGKEMVIEIANQAMLKIWGKDEDIRGKKIRDALSELSAQPISDMLDHVYRSGIPSLAEQQSVVMEKDGVQQTCWFNFTYKPLYNARGKIYGILNMAVDISSMVNLQKQKDEFIAIASHELKTPFTSIKAYNQLLLKTVDPAGKAYIFAAKAHENSLRLGKLINDLLDVSKINAGKLVYEKHEFEFSEAVSESVDTVKHTSGTHRIIIEKSVNLNYYGDRFRLEQVIINFLTNAIKYSPDADKVIVRSEVLKDNLVVSVRDFGIGIKKESINRLFERFYRVDNTAMRFQGLGLGLYISSEILQQHKGSFWIESEPGQGSTFYMGLPLSPQELKQLETKSLSYLDLSFDETGDFLHADWKGFLTMESVKEGCMTIIHLLKEKGAVKILNSNIHVLGTWTETSEWMGKEWFPMLEEAGCRHFAWVYSNNTFGRLPVNKSMELISSSVQTKLFKDKNKGIDWLRRQSV